jgi:hypothetical protein
MMAIMATTVWTASRSGHADETCRLRHGRRHEIEAAASTAPRPMVSELSSRATDGEVGWMKVRA